jgi:hypothetical protein
MPAADEFCSYLGDLLEGRYDCVDRICLRAYFPLGSISGGLLSWWNQLNPGQCISEPSLRRIAGDFSRRVKAFSAKQQIPLQYCEIGQKGKHLQAEKLRPKEANYQGVFLILVSRASAPVWQVYKTRRDKLLIRWPKRWPLINHYHFHIIDKQWGHLLVRNRGHPPFGAQVLLNGHEWLERKALQHKLDYHKESNCFTNGSDLWALDELATRLAGPAGLVQLAASLRPLDLPGRPVLWLDTL